MAVRLGSLSAAAREMGMSPAMAARHLGDLETRLGTTLVNRTTRRLALTEAGADYLDRAERILADLREAEADAAARSVTAEGLLRVSAPATFGVIHLAKLIPEFRRRHPRVTVEFGFSDRYVDLLEERWDAAVRIGRLPDSNLIARRLAPMRLAVCASPAYFAARGKPAALDDLARHDCLGYTIVTGVGTSTWGFGPDGTIKVPVEGSMHANNGEGLLRAAIAGLGLVYGPRFIAADALRSGELVEVALDVPLMDLGAVHTITHPNRRPAAKTRAWMNFLAEVIPPMAFNW